MAPEPNRRVVSPSDRSLENLPAARGIYQITDGRVSYVGLSDNIRRRIYKHIESRACRSRIVLDTGRARVVVLELLPQASDRVLAEREWYWFERLQQQGHVLVNAPESLGRTGSGRYSSPKSLASTEATVVSPQARQQGGRFFLLWWLAAVLVGLFSFGSGYLAMQYWLRWRATQQAERSLPEFPTLENCWQSLKRGDRNEAVRTLQEQLLLLGFYREEVDGIFGSGTQTAVAAFQRQQGLVADAIVDCKTQQALQAALGDSTLPSSQTSTTN